MADRDGDAVAPRNLGYAIELGADRRARALVIEEHVAAERRDAGLVREPQPDRARAGAGIEEQQAAPGQFGDHQAHARLVLGEPAAHVVVDADEALEPAEVPVDPAGQLGRREVDHQGVRTGIDRPVVRPRLHRDVHQQFVPAAARLGGQRGHVVAVGQEGQRHRRRQPGGPARAGGIQPDVVDDDGDAADRRRRHRQPVRRRRQHGRRLRCGWRHRLGFRPPCRLRRRDRRQPGHRSRRDRWHRGRRQPGCRPRRDRRHRHRGRLFDRQVGPGEQDQPRHQQAGQQREAAASDRQQRAQAASAGRSADRGPVPRCRPPRRPRPAAVPACPCGRQCRALPCCPASRAP